MTLKSAQGLQLDRGMGTQITIGAIRARPLQVDTRQGPIPRRLPSWRIQDTFGHVAAIARVEPRMTKPKVP